MWTKKKVATDEEEKKKNKIKIHDLKQKRLSHMISCLF
jgi:hypothetical protein